MREGDEMLDALIKATLEEYAQSRGFPPDQSELTVFNLAKRPDSKRRSGDGSKP